MSYPTRRVAVALAIFASAIAVQWIANGPASPLFWGPLILAVPVLAFMALTVAVARGMKPPGVPSDEQLNRALRSYDEFVKANDGQPGFASNEHLHMGALGVALMVANRPSPWSPRGWYYNCATAAWMRLQRRS